MSLQSSVNTALTRRACAVARVVLLIARDAKLGALGLLLPRLLTTILYQKYYCYEPTNHLLTHEIPLIRAIH